MDMFMLVLASFLAATMYYGAHAIWMKRPPEVVEHSLDLPDLYRRAYELEPSFYLKEHQMRTIKKLRLLLEVAKLALWHNMARASYDRIQAEAAQVVVNLDNQISFYENCQEINGSRLYLQDFIEADIVTFDRLCQNIDRAIFWLLKKHRNLKGFEQGLRGLSDDLSNYLDAHAELDQDDNDPTD